MKKIIHTTALATLLLLVACNGCFGQQKMFITPNPTAQQDTIETSNNKILPFEYGSYVEVSKMMGMEIKKTIYFDKWGEWVAIEEKSEPETVDENAVPMDRLLIIKGKTHWHIDFIEKFATKQEAAVFSPGLTVFNNVTKRMTADDMEVKELETENHLDFDCKKNHIIYKSIEIEVTTLTYDNFTMKMTGKMENMDIEYEVISIDLTAPPASIFELPEGIEMRYRF